MGREPLAARRTGSILGRSNQRGLEGDGPVVTTHSGRLTRLPLGSTGAVLSTRVMNRRERCDDLEDGTSCYSRFGFVPFRLFPTTCRTCTRYLTYMIYLVVDVAFRWLPMDHAQKAMMPLSTPADAPVVQRRTEHGPPAATDVGS